MIGTLKAKDQTTINVYTKLTMNIPVHKIAGKNPVEAFDKLSICELFLELMDWDRFSKGLPKADKSAAWTPYNLTANAARCSCGQIIFVEQNCMNVSRMETLTESFFVNPWPLRSKVFLISLMFITWEEEEDIEGSLFSCQN